MLSRLSSLSANNISKLNAEADNIFDRKHPMYEAATLVDSYCQHFLKPLIDSERNVHRHFLKISFFNKGVEFIDLPKILKDKSVIACVPRYFKNQETPIICYKYNRPIRNLIFNYSKVSSDVDIESNTPNSCDCSSSQFCYFPAGHVVTGDLRIISDDTLREIISKGPKYRVPSKIDFEKCRSQMQDSITDFCNKWCRREKADTSALSSWMNKVFSIIDKKILFYRKNPSLLPRKSSYSIAYLKKAIVPVHDKYVLVPADKAANNTVII